MNKQKQYELASLIEENVTLEADSEKIFRKAENTALNLAKKEFQQFFTTRNFNVQLDERNNEIVAINEKYKITFWPLGRIIRIEQTDIRTNQVASTRVEVTSLGRRNYPGYKGSYNVSSSTDIELIKLEKSIIEQKAKLEHNNQSHSMASLLPAAYFVFGKEYKNFTELLSERIK